jgi:hypothetical protein
VPEVAVKVNVLAPVPGDAILGGAKLAVTPAGNPLADNATCDWNPFHTAVDSLIEAELPGATAALVALVVSEKLGGGKTVRLTACVFVTPPPVAVTVRL